MQSKNLIDRKCVKRVKCVKCMGPAGKRLIIIIIIIAEEVINRVHFQLQFLGAAIAIA